MRSGRPSLALDLIEEFRVPLADRLAVSMLTRRELLERDFETTDGTFWSLSDAGRRKVLARLTELRAVPVRHQLLDHRAPGRTAICPSDTSRPPSSRRPRALPAVRDECLMELIVIYDISTPDEGGHRRLARVAKVCERFGIRVQQSVFECRITDSGYERFVSSLREVIDEDVDSVTIYQIPGGIGATRVELGRIVQNVDSPWIV